MARVCFSSSNSLKLVQRGPTCKHVGRKQEEVEGGEEGEEEEEGEKTVLLFVCIRCCRLSEHLDRHYAHPKLLTTRNFQDGRKLALGAGRNKEPPAFGN